MRNTKKVTRVSEDEIIVSITCDICKKEYQEGWGKESSHDVLETEIKLRVGTAYPECNTGEITQFDICPTCFTEKLIPALKQLGAEPTVKDWDYSY